MSLLKRISSLLRIGRARHFVGYDLDRNKYYEFPALDGSKDPRHTRRLIRYAEHRPLGEYRFEDLPIQWRMWLRHTRRSAPTIEELESDRQRQVTIAERVRLLEAEQAERKLLLERRPESHAESQPEAAVSPEAPVGTGEATQSVASGANVGTGRRSASVPTAAVDVGAESSATAQADPSGASLGARDGQAAGRAPDMDVWEASRARLRAADRQASHASTSASASQSPTTDEQRGDADDLASAVERRAQRRAQRNEAERERERARRLMRRSPYEDFEVDVVGPPNPAAPASPSSSSEQATPRAGGPQSWKPQAWEPSGWTGAPKR